MRHTKPPKAARVFDSSSVCERARKKLVPSVYAHLAKVAHHRPLDELREALGVERAHGLGEVAVHGGVVEVDRLRGV